MSGRPPRIAPTATTCGLGGLHDLAAPFVLASANYAAMRRISSELFALSVYVLLIPAGRRDKPASEAEQWEFLGHYQEYLALMRNL